MKGQIPGNDNKPEDRKVEKKRNKKGKHKKKSLPFLPSLVQNTSGEGHRPWILWAYSR